jgi:hypothetical protein
MIEAPPKGKIFKNQTYSRVQEIKMKSYFIESESGVDYGTLPLRITQNA